MQDRHFKIDSFKWLKDTSLEDSDDLPEPDELATDAIAELQSAIQELNAVLAALENGNGVKAEEAELLKVAEQAGDYGSR